MVYAVWENTNHAFNLLMMEKKKIGYHGNFNVDTVPWQL